MKNANEVPSKPDHIKGGQPIVLHAPRTDANLPNEKSEEAEVAGRHKNSGQKNHKGAR